MMIPRLCFSFLKFLLSIMNIRIVECVRFLSTFFCTEIVFVAGDWMSLVLTFFSDLSVGVYSIYLALRKCWDVEWGLFCWHYVEIASLCGPFLALLFVSASLSLALLKLLNFRSFALCLIVWIKCRTFYCISSCVLFWWVIYRQF